MSKKNLLSGRDKELQELADQYEAAKSEGKNIYLDSDDFADLADWYAMHRKYDMAQEVLDYGMGIHPNNAVLMVEQANLFLELDRTDEAKEVVAQIDETIPEATVLKADILYIEGKEEEAEAVLDTLEDKDDLLNVVDVSYMYLDNGKPEKALERLERVKKHYKDEEAYIATMGDCYLMMGDTEKAAEYFDRLIDKTPYSAPFWYGLARCYFDQEMYDKTIEACDYATVIDEEYGDAYMLRGQAYAHLENGEKAVENFLQAEKCNVIPHSFIDSYMGMSYCFTGEWKKGYEHLEKVIKAHDKPYDDQIPIEDIYLHAATCLFNLGKMRKAHQYCRKVQKAVPDEAYSYLLEGRIYMEEGDVENATTKWAEALEIAPGAETWNDIGQHCMETGELRFARYAFEQVKTIKPDFEGINEMLAALCIVLNDKRSFSKYNRLCKHPLSRTQMQKLHEIFNDTENTDLPTIMKNLLNALLP